MTGKDMEWGLIAANNDWYMPRVSRWKRWPVVRHVRTLRAAMRVHRHYQIYTGLMGMASTGYDEWVLYGMWRGYERLTQSEAND